MNIVELLGIIAGLLTSFAYLPQIIKIVRTRSVKNISLPMYAVLIVGIILWLVYGFLIKSPSMIIANTMSLMFSSVIFILKIKWDQ